MSVQTETNSRVYASRRRVSEYVARRLTPAEIAVLEALRPALEGSRVLEIGCGAGAITRALLALTDDVVAVDVAPAMVAHCRSVFAKGTFLVADLRDLSRFSDASYDVVVAAANVVDIVQHDERPAAFGELRRVLRDDGLLYFSTHNRNSAFALHQARHGPELRLGGSPYAQLRALAAFAVGTMNHRRLARHQVFAPDYAIINDSAHRWSLLHHYVTRAAQVRQLADCGFDVVSVRDATGATLEPSDDDDGSTEFHFVARAVRGSPA